MAIDHEYDIIPISSIGAEHCTSVLIDIPVPTIITSFIGEKSFNIPLVVPNLWTVSTWPRFHLTAGERISSMEFTTGDGENLDLQSGLLRDRVKQIILVQQRESLQAISDASTITNGKNE